MYQWHLKFQFHNGTINTFSAFPCVQICFWFQFHNGTINTESSWSIDAAFRRFQFHNGTINTIIGQSKEQRTSKFQFHNGTINTFLCRWWVPRHWCFNSTTVQLIRKSVLPASVTSMFQFHNGTINTRGKKYHQRLYPVSIPQRYN